MFLHTNCGCKHDKSSEEADHVTMTYLVKWAVLRREFQISFTNAASSSCFSMLSFWKCFYLRQRSNSTRVTLVLVIQDEVIIIWNLLPEQSIWECSYSRQTSTSIRETPWFSSQMIRCSPIAPYSDANMICFSMIWDRHEWFAFGVNSSVLAYAWIVSVCFDIDTDDFHPA